MPVPISTRIRCQTPADSEPSPPVAYAPACRRWSSGSILQPKQGAKLIVVDARHGDWVMHVRFWGEITRDDC